MATASFLVDSRQQPASIGLDCHAGPSPARNDFKAITAINLQVYLWIRPRDDRAFDIALKRK